MLQKLIEQGFGSAEDYNCAEKIVYGANLAYSLNLDKSTLKLSAGFGGGMGIESVCGALTGCVMVLSHFYVEDRAHESTKIKELTQEVFRRYQEEMQSIDCKTLKEKYRTPETHCLSVIAVAAKILDELVARRAVK